MIMCKILVFLPIHLRQLRNHQSTVTTWRMRITSKLSHQESRWKKCWQIDVIKNWPKKLKLIRAKNLHMNQTLTSLREYLFAWRNKKIILTKPRKDCNKMCKFSLTQYQTHFKWCHKCLFLHMEHLLILILNLFIILRTIMSFQIIQWMRHSTHPMPHPHNTDTLCSSTGDGVRGSNSSNENEIEINIDEKNEKVFRQL